MKKNRILICLILLIAMPIASANDNLKKEKKEYAERAKTAFMKGWNAYKNYAWGLDAVNPISKKGHNGIQNLF